MIERRRSGLPGAMRVSELLDRFEAERLPLLAESTRRTYSDSLRSFRAYFVDQLEDPDVRNVRAGNVRGYLSWRRLRRFGEAGVASARTLAKDRTVLHGVFAFAEELEVVDGNPVRRVKPPKSDARSPVILEDDQFEALLEACERDEHGHKLAEAPMLRMYVLLLNETGLRCDSEALWLRWTDLDLEGAFVRVESSAAKGRRTKSGRSRWVPMTPRLRSSLREHVMRFRGATYGAEQQTSPWVFHHLYSRRNAKAGARVTKFRTGFAAAAARAGLPASLHQHDLRHRRVTTWLAGGASPMLVKEAMGHSDVRVTQGYTHLVREHLRALVGDLAQQAAGNG
jgi:integrase/recombinase XerD